MKKITSAIIAAIILMPITAFAGEKTIKLSVPDMNCASCPYMVKQSILKIDGIVAVDATMIDRSATVTFDDSITNVDEIQQATADIGYVSFIMQ